MDNQFIKEDLQFIEDNLSVNSNSLNKAKKVANTLSSYFRPAVTLESNIIVFKWTRPDVDLEITFQNDGSIYVFYFDAYRGKMETIQGASRKEIDHILNRYCAKH